MRNLLSKVTLVSCRADLWELLDNVKIEVSSLDFENINQPNEVCIVTWNDKPEFVEENDSSNVILAIWTTSAARLHLYEALKKVEEAGGEILYMDTDSIIYKIRDDQDDPLKEGEFFGELTDEEPGKRITEFLSGGCKNYAYWVEDVETGKGDYRMKVRGFSLDWATRGLLPYEKFK